MEIIINKNTDPTFNLACEEFFLERTRRPVFMLWRNSRAVIVGKNQNTAAEVDRLYCEENGIKIVRRMTGGGAVFHDLGNVNYTYIEQNEMSKFSNYALFTKDIIDYLATLGVVAELSGRNDVLVEGKKIMGNAQCVKGGNIMHHGCILFSADLSVLSKALNVSQVKIEGKGIKSVSSRVVNIADCLKEPISTETFIKGLETFMIKRYNCNARELTEEETRKIGLLAKEKYSSFNWNFGSSPDYSFKKSEKFPFGIVSASFNVQSGVICDISLSGDFFGVEDVSTLEDTIKGVKHDENALKDALGAVDIDLFIKGCKLSDLIKILI